MNEDQARRIFTASDLSGYSHQDLQRADQWVKVYATNKLAQHLKRTGVTVAMKDYILLMVKCHYGSVETDEFLKAHQCYPDWVR